MAETAVSKRSRFPQPALTHEEMWHAVKNHIAGMVMDRHTPQAIFNLREYMGELERFRTQPYRDFIKARNAS